MAGRQAGWSGGRGGAVFERTACDLDWHPMQGVDPEGLSQRLAAFIADPFVQLGQYMRGKNEIIFLNFLKKLIIIIIFFFSKIN